MVILVVMEGFDPVGAMAAAVAAGSAFKTGEGHALHARVEDVMADAQALVGRINADQAALVTKTAELMSLWNAGADLGWGYRSIEHRLANELKLTRREATLLSIAAEHLPVLPELMTAFAHGEVPLTVAAPVAEIACPATDAALTEQTRYATAAATLKMVAARKKLVRDQQGEPEEKQESFRVSPRGDGYEVRGNLSATNGAVFAKLLAQRRQELFQQTGEKATTAEALMSLLELGPGLPADRFLAVLQIDVEVFRAWQETRDTARGCDQPEPAGTPNDPAPTGVTILNGPPVTEAELDTIHGEISARWVVTRNGHPLWISSKQRTAPAWMRTAMDLEQHDCQVLGCDREGFLEAHHSIPFTDKAETLYEEQVYFCPFHHDALHAAGATAEFTTDRKIIIRDADGNPVSFTGCPIPPSESPDQRERWTGRGTNTGGQDHYDRRSLDNILGYLHDNTPRPDPGPEPDDGGEGATGDCSSRPHTGSGRSGSHTPATSAATPAEPARPIRSDPAVRRFAPLQPRNVAAVRPAPSDPMAPSRSAASASDEAAGEFAGEGVVFARHHSSDHRCDIARRRAGAIVFRRPGGRGPNAVDPVPDARNRSRSRRRVCQPPTDPDRSIRTVLRCRRSSS